MVDEVQQEFLLFSIGPVQSYIGAARRTQDLWLGSQLLSNLAEVGVSRANELGTVIYPVQVDGRWPQSVPNRFVVSVNNGSGASVAKTVTEAIQMAWGLAAAKVQSYFGQLAPENSWSLDWHKQVTNWLEFYWIVWPRQGDYGNAYRQASLALDARKQMRHIPMVAEPGETCSLCGMRKALHGRQNGTRAVAQFWAGVREQPRVTGAELRQNEQLCAICTIKRFAGRSQTYIGRNLLQPTERFPSTSSVAAAGFKAKLLAAWTETGSSVLAHLDAIQGWGPGAPYSEPELSPFLDKLVGEKEGGKRLLKFDGDFFYPESFAEGHLEELLGRVPTIEDVQRSRRAADSLRRLYKQAEQAQIAPPSPYLSILAMDGDRMGRALGQSRSLTQHQQISNALAHFAEEDVPHIVQHEFTGRVIYAGGDDVLALLPIEHALPASNALRLRFSQRMAAAELPHLTASSGLAFGHRTFPLGATMIAARRAEGEAKSGLGRNALAIELIRRSGATDRIGTKWHYTGLENETLDVMDELFDYLLKGALSGKVAYDLEREAVALQGIPSAQEDEIRRLLTRHWQEKPLDTYKLQVVGMATKLAALAQPGRIGIRRLAGWLLLLRFLGRGERE